MKYIYLLIFCIHSISSFSQVVTFKGTFKDIKSNPIAYANIVFFNKNQGATSDLKGNFLIEGRHNDTLKISHIAYQTIVIVLDSNQQQLKLVMQEKSLDLDEVTVNATQNIHLQGKTKRVGYNKYKGNSSFHLSTGRQLATYINNEQKQAGIIKKIKVKIKNKGKCKAEKIRIRLLSNNKNVTQPDEDILQEQLIFSVHEVKKRLTIDVSEYNLIFPKEGLFVVVEWLNDNNECRNENNDSFSIEATLENKQNIVWFSYMDRKWSKRPTTIMSNQIHCMTPKVGLEVLY